MKAFTCRCLTIDFSQPMKHHGFRDYRSEEDRGAHLHHGVYHYICPDCKGFKWIKGSLVYKIRKDAWLKKRLIEERKF